MVAIPVKPPAAISLGAVKTEIPIDTKTLPAIKNKISNLLDFKLKITSHL